MKNAIKYSLLFLLLICAGRAKASHIYGADFYYTHITGNSYALNLVVYGDCGGSAFPNLFTSNAEVFIFNGTAFSQSIILSLQSPTTGVEVSPVCPAQISNTKCNGGSLPGVKKFVYSGSINLGSTSPNWRFVFTGAMGGGTAAGRSGAIGNIPLTANIMVLEATLNNTITPANSSPTYTTIPTPFFVNGKPASFNPGTVDINGDSLTYKLVSGLETDPLILPFAYNNLTYVFPYTATAPLSATAGTFSFDTTNGQLDFTPSMVQQSLVVYKVSEYRNGVLVGSSMREMTFVVINGTNDPPTAGISSVVGGKRKTKSVVEACQGNISFNLNPTDANGDNITITSQGLPAGAALTVTGNGTSAPSAAFSWNASTVAPGTYTFFLTYADDGCPLKSTQTQAYAVIIVPPVTFSYATLSQATCVRKAEYTVTTTVNPDTMKIKVMQGGVIIDSGATVNGVFTDSLMAGTYTIRVINPAGCYKDTTIVIDNPITTQFTATYDLATCNQYSDGAIYVNAHSGTPPYQYAIDAGAFGSSSIFSGLPGGTYVVRAKDANECIKDTTLTLDDSVRLAGTVTPANVLCYQQNDGSITVTASSAYGGPYVYRLNGVVQPSNIMGNLPAATYIVRAEDSKGCYKADTLTITEPSQLVSQTVSDNISCYGAKDGIVSVSTAGGTPAYNFSLNNGPYTTTPIFPGLSKGQYIVEIRDFNGCKEWDTVTVHEPTILSVFNIVLTHPKCHNTSDAEIDVLGLGGTPSYTYTAQGQTNTTGNISGLSPGATLVVITDKRGCSVDTTVTLVAPSAVVASIGVKQSTCAELDNGAITVTGNGGFAPYRYAIDTTFTAQTKYEGLAAGTYTIRVKDANDCVLSNSVTISDSLYVHTGAVVTDVSCHGYEDGSVIFTPAGGASPYTIAFHAANDFSSNMTYTGYAANEYSVRIKDALGCMGDTIISIGSPDVMVVDTEVVYNNCYGKSLTGRIAINVTGGTQPYTYTWNNSKPAEDNVMSSLANGNYVVYIQDAKGCKDTAIALLEYKDCCTPFMPSAFTPNGDGKNDLFRLVSKGDIRLKELQIYNRYGQRIFMSSDIADSWDGTFKGEPVDAGTYFYFLKANCGNNNERLVEFKGDVTVVR